jgi:hypothetical protein
MTDVLTRIEGKVGILSLNRPSAIHALTLDMVRLMTAALLDWRDNPTVEAVIIDHAAAPDGDPKLSRGFCSGGDIAFLRNSALNDDGVSGRKFFHDEYQLNHLLFTYPKPVISFMDGITMGGGELARRGLDKTELARVLRPRSMSADPGLREIQTLITQLAVVIHQNGQRSARYRRMSGLPGGWGSAKTAGQETPTCQGKRHAPRRSAS